MVSPRGEWVHIHNCGGSHPSLLYISASTENLEQAMQVSGYIGCFVKDVCTQAHTPVHAHSCSSGCVHMHTQLIFLSVSHTS